MSEWFDLASKVVPVGVTGVLSVLGTWATTRRKETATIKELQKKVNALEVGQTRARSDLDGKIEELKAKLSKLEEELEEFGEELDTCETAADRKVVTDALAESITVVQTSLANQSNKLRSQQYTLNTLVTEVASKANKASLDKLDQSVEQSAKDGQEQWQEIHRTVGRLEGILHALQQRRSSGGFPSPIQQ